MDTFREILGRLPSSIGQELEVLPDSVVSQIEEIRLRCKTAIQKYGQDCLTYCHRR